MLNFKWIECVIKKNMLFEIEVMLWGMGKIDGVRV